MSALPSGAHRAGGTRRDVQWQDPRPGGPGIYGTWDLFDVRGERVAIHISRKQARLFLDFARALAPRS